jgi:aspartyl-tRNA(Asn)/glutamyl-tRNA(Gln) amidotransferase subunit A
LTAALDLPLRALARVLWRGDVAAGEVARESLDRIEHGNGRLNAFLSVDRAGAVEAADRADRAHAAGAARGALHGAPIALKDLIGEAGAPFTCGSALRRGIRADRDSDAAARLRAAGANFVGRTNLHEFAYGISNENPHFGPARNPWDPSRIPGGSSGGSAVAIAAGWIPVSLGTDTGGSIRIPAALCGIAGLKPTYDLVSRAGVFPLSPSLDHVGPMARRVDDLALLLETLAGPSAVRGYVDGGGLHGVRLGLPRSYFWEHLGAGVGEAVEAAVRQLEALGARVVDVGRDFGAAASAAATAILMAEAAAGHRHGVRANPTGYGADVRERVYVGLALPAERYVRGRQARRALIRELRRTVFAEVDALVTPTTPEVATPIGLETIDVAGKPNNTRAAMTRFTNPFNALGFPALSVPCGMARELPVGMQIVGRPGEDGFVLRLGAAYERARGPFPEPASGPSYVRRIQPIGR